jgi:hypothetical protein
MVGEPFIDMAFNLKIYVVDNLDLALNDIKTFKK